MPLNIFDKILEKIKGRGKTEKAKIGYKWVLTLLMDVAACVFAYLLATVIVVRHINWSSFAMQGKAIAFGTAVVSTLLFLLLFRCYKVVWQHAGVSEVINVVGAHIAAYIVLMVVCTIINVSTEHNILVATLTLYLFFSLFITMIIRFHKPFLKVLARRFWDRKQLPPQNILIYGAGLTGAQVAKRYIASPEEGFNPVAIIDDDPEKLRNMVSGLRVVGGREIIPDAMKKYKAKIIVIAITNLNREELRQIYLFCVEHGAIVKMVNNVGDAENKIQEQAISFKKIQLEDLLRRKEHKVNKELLENLIFNKTVMVTGGAGSIGSELCRQALQNNCRQVIVFDHHENGMFEMGEELSKLYTQDRFILVVGSVKDRSKLRAVMEQYKPQIVFHAAAYKHVPMMEINVDEAVKNNIFGTKNVIEQCEESEVEKFILVSTDKAVNPANIMGASKRMAELLVQTNSKHTKTICAAVRFGNVLGSSGSVIPTFVKQINAGGPVTVTDKEMKRYFMTIPEAVRLVMQAGGLAKGNEVFVLDMGEPVYIYDLAFDLIKLSGLVPEKDIKIEITGLRRGEKLFEELRFQSEDVNNSIHDGIFVCKLEEVDEDRLYKTLDKLADATASGKGPKEIEDYIFEMVPRTYRS